MKPCTGPLCQAYRPTDPHSDLWPDCVSHECCRLQVQTFFAIFSLQDVEVKWIEYQNMVNYLVQWIRHHVATMSERTFPNNPVELKVCVPTEVK